MTTIEQLRQRHEAAAAWIRDNKTYAILIAAFIIGALWCLLVYTAVEDDEARQEAQEERDQEADPPTSPAQLIPLRPKAATKTKTTPQRVPIERETAGAADPATPSAEAHEPAPAEPTP